MIIPSFLPKVDPLVIIYLKLGPFVVSLIIPAFKLSVVVKVCPARAPAAAHTACGATHLLSLICRPPLFMLQLAAVHVPGEAVQAASLVSRPPEPILHVPLVLFQFPLFTQACCVVYVPSSKSRLPRASVYTSYLDVAIIRTLPDIPEPKFCSVIVCVASVLTLNISCIPPSFVTR